MTSNELLIRIANEQIPAFIEITVTTPQAVTFEHVKEIAYMATALETLLHPLQPQPEPKPERPQRPPIIIDDPEPYPDAS